MTGEGGETVVTLIAAGNSGHVCAALIDGNTHGGKPCKNRRLENGLEQRLPKAG